MVNIQQMSAGSETKMLKVHFIPAISQTLPWELWEKNKENTSSCLKQQSSVLMSHEALSPQTGSQVPWDMERGHSQEHRARAKRRNFQREGDSHDPESLGTRRVPPHPLMGQAQLMWVQQNISYWPAYFCSDLNFKQPMVSFSPHQPWEQTIMDFTTLRALGSHTRFAQSLHKEKGSRCKLN